MLDGPNGTGPQLPAKGYFLHAMGSAKVVSFYGYDDCVQLETAGATVVITPHGGGRVLRYNIAGDTRNAIHLDDHPNGLWESGDVPKPDCTPEGWRWAGDGSDAGDPFGPTGGRFDIGPEFQTHRSVCQMTEANHHALWLGTWTVEALDPAQPQITLTSIADDGALPPNIPAPLFPPLPHSPSLHRC